MINSPFKRSLADRVGPLEPLVERKREIIGCGAQSVVLANNHKEVYVVTRTIVAQSIELLREFPEQPHLFSVPKLVGINKDLAKLMSPDAPEKTKKQIRKLYDINPPQLWNSNLVYLLPRYHGTLEDLTRFNEESIKTLEKTLLEAVTYFHDNGLSHNDIALRNVFFKGESPHLTFFLGDFGKVTKNDEGTHDARCAKDLMRCNALIEKVKKALEHKEEIRNKNVEQNKNYLPSRRQLSSRINIQSPKISPVAQASILHEIQQPPERASRKLI